jgi:hypothetical protein
VVSEFAVTSRNRFGWGTEHENKLTVLVERERAIRDHENKERGIGLGCWQVSSGSCNGDARC